MNIQQFQYVLAVVDSKNFEDAAERCFITQSTLSTMIGRFENEIGIKIFNRKTKPVSVTAEGELLIKRLRIISNEVGALKKHNSRNKRRNGWRTKAWNNSNCCPLLTSIVSD